MTYAYDPSDSIARMPSWVNSARAETLEDAAFLSGAALSHLELLLGHSDVPHALLRERLALRAAEACVAFSGRPERAGDLRDALAFSQVGDRLGPAGEVYLSWTRAVSRPVSIKALSRALPTIEPEQIAWCLDQGQGSAVSRAVAVLESVPEARPCDQAAALLLADAALSQALRWSHLVPLLSVALKHGDLRKTGNELRFVCHRAITSAAVKASQEASILRLRAMRLKEITPKLRAKGAGDAVALFLRRDAVAATDLTSLRSSRSARRFCDRLVNLLAIRELTGRESFRLYGV